MQGSTARHIIASSTYPEKNTMLYILHAVGARRCTRHLANCTDGCSPTGSFGGVPLDLEVVSRGRTSYDEFLDSAMLGTTIRNTQIGYVGHRLFLHNELANMNLFLHPPTCIPEIISQI